MVPNCGTAFRISNVHASERSNCESKAASNACLQRGERICNKASMVSRVKEVDDEEEEDEDEVNSTASLVVVVIGRQEEVLNANNLIQTNQSPRIGKFNGNAGGVVVDG